MERSSKKNFHTFIQQIVRLEWIEKDELLVYFKKVRHRLKIDWDLDRKDEYVYILTTVRLIMQWQF